MYKKLETAIRVKVQSSDDLDFRANIDLTFDQGVIEVNEKAKLHQYRKKTNQLIYEDQEDFPRNLILAVYKVLIRIEDY